MKTTHWLIINSIILLVLLAMGIYSLSQKEKNVYLDTAEVFNGFKLQKELRTKLENVQSARQAILDSIQLRLTAISSSSDFDPQNPGEEFFSLRGLYQQRQKQFEEDNQRLSNEYDRQIWNQLNQYVKDYGKEHNYTIIFGANGQGNIMYASETRDITKELIDYINNKYERV